MLVYAIPTLSFVVSVIVWFFRGRDAQGRGISITEYEPPLDLSPAEIGVLLDYKATDREIAATIIDLSFRKYIAIRKLEKKRFLGKYTVYEFELLRDDVLDLRSHEKSVINGLFGVVGSQFTAAMQAKIKDPVAREKALRQYPAGTVSLIGRRVTLDEIKPYFYQSATQAKKDIYNQLTAKGYFKKSPLESGVDFIILAILGIVLVPILGRTYYVSLGVSVAIFIFFAIYMNARSKSGQYAKEVAEGFATYLRTVEKDKLALLQSPNAARTGADGAVVYERFLPYAVALDMEAEWTSSFEDAFSQSLAVDMGTVAGDMIDVVRSIAAVVDFLTP